MAITADARGIRYYNSCTTDDINKAARLRQLNRLPLYIFNLDGAKVLHFSDMRKREVHFFAFFLHFFAEKFCLI